MKPFIPNYAGRAERFFAYLIDVLIVMVPVALLAKSFLSKNDAGDLIVEPAAYAVTFLINLSYHTYFVASRWQATPGMRLLSMYVARTDTRPLQLRDAVERFLAFFIPTLPSYASFIPANQAPILVLWLTAIWFAPILFRPDRTGLHDRLCGTRVLVGRVGA